jgi:predicted transcriptional regulator
MRIEKIKERIERDKKTKKRFLDNLKCLKSEMQNLESDRGFRDYHASESYDDIIKKYDDVLNHVEDLINEIEENNV